MTDDLMPPPLPDGHVCPPYTVPGWLNGDGLPTSCVGDHPCPGFDPVTCEGFPVLEPPIAQYPDPLPLDPLLPEIGEPLVVVQPVPRELAETGPGMVVEPFSWAVAIIVMGVIVFVASRDRGPYA